MFILKILLSRRGELNPWPLPYQGSALPLSYSGLKKWAGDGTRIRDPQLGRLMLYQLSYSRLISSKVSFIQLPISSRTYGLVLFQVGRAGFEPTKAFASRFTVCPSWPLWYLPLQNRIFALKTHILKSFKSRWRDSNPRPADYKSAALTNWATSAI